MKMHIPTAEATFWNPFREHVHIVQKTVRRVVTIPRGTEIRFGAVQHGDYSMISVVSAVALGRSVAFGTEGLYVNREKVLTTGLGMIAAGIETPDLLKQAHESFDSMQNAYEQLLLDAINRTSNA